MQMYCIGCGAAVCQMEQGQTMAISCGTCGAGSPILLSEDRTFIAPPASLVFAMNGPGFAYRKEPPHLEYYLGYSAHESDLKSQVTRNLKALGATSQRDCPREDCRQAYTRALERQQGPLERQRRIQEIGEP